MLGKLTSNSRGFMGSPISDSPEPTVYRPTPNYTAENELSSSLDIRRVRTLETQSDTHEAVVQTGRAFPIRGQCAPSQTTGNRCLGVRTQGYRTGTNVSPDHGLHQKIESIKVLVGFVLFCFAFLDQG